MTHTDVIVNQIINHLKHLHPGALRRVLAFVERERGRYSDLL